MYRKYYRHADSDTDSEEEFYHRIHRRPREKVVVEEKRRPRSASVANPYRGGDAQIYIDIKNDLQENTKLAPPQVPVGRARSASQRRPVLADALSDLEDDIIRHERRAIRRLEREEPSRRAEIEAEIRLERIRQRERELDEMRKEEDRMRREDRIRREERERIEASKGSGNASAQPQPQTQPQPRQETELEREIRIAKEEEIRSLRRWRKLQEYMEMQEMGRLEKRPERDDHPLTRRDIEKEIQFERLKKMENALLIERMKVLEKEREEKERERKIREKVQAEIAQKEKDEMERLQKEAKLKASAIEEYKKKEAERLAKQKEEAEKAKKEFNDKVNQLLGSAGFSEDKITAIMQGKSLKEMELVHVEKHVHHGKHRQIEDEEAFVKVHRRYLEPRTLDAFSLIWEFDPNDADYMLIYHSLSQEEQDRLFDHTRKLRGQRTLTASPHNGPVTVEMKVNDKKRDGLYLVRKKQDRRSLFW
ncbi:uncharacterized protein ARB_03700 [Trichophyton benhamiae CBS 112371]|uniref:Uncharacterized protein n=1 Tax=Arthroderma benhamiae (strain ATCC MYA-4681 / CBS 112371) TaxID=663331 RepID=D4B5G0_ARTBC|nr:uncharacterized protein ARB_03700 [Trichophyton benhamiae CBS 112371]EFE29446.1 conserved hypothetical protein [Trichophyton benhamiae CBS 112371]